MPLSIPPALPAFAQLGEAHLFLFLFNFYKEFLQLLDIAIPVMAMVFGICFFIEMNIMIDAKEHGGVGSMAQVAYVPVSSIDNILLAKKAAEASWVPPKTVSVEIELPLKQITFQPDLISREPAASQSVILSPGGKQRVALDVPTTTGGKIQLLLDHSALASIIRNKYSRKEAEITLDLGTLLALNTSGAIIPGEGEGGAMQKFEWPLGGKEPKVEGENAPVVAENGDNGAKEGMRASVSNYVQGLASALVAGEG
ncbi:hypothetical protein FOL47_011390, partial [Perkinsus chesapeaki]